MGFRASCDAKVTIACLISVGVNVTHGRVGLLGISVGEGATSGGGNMVEWNSIAFSSKVTAIIMENDRGGVLWIFLSFV